MKAKVELTFPPELKDEPIICELCKKFDIVLSILEASFSTEVGWAILVLEGQEPDVNKAIQYLTGSGAEVKDIQTKP